MDGTARAVADLAEGQILASVEVAAPPERVFRALASDEIVNWWVRPGVFDTREWAGDVRVGGHWEASGIGGGRPYTLEGAFLEVEPPRKLVHTWYPSGAPAAATTVAYVLEAREVCSNTCIGWETSFERLADLLAERATSMGPQREQRQRRAGS